MLPEPGNEVLRGAFLGAHYLQRLNEDRVLRRGSVGATTLARNHIPTFSLTSTQPSSASYTSTAPPIPTSR